MPLPYYDARGVGPVLDVVRRKINQMKAAGQIISPSTETALIEAELNTASNNMSKDRAIAEDTRRFNVSQATNKEQFAQTMDQRNKELKSAEKGQLMSGLGSLAGTAGSIYTLGKAGGVWGTGAKALPVVKESIDPAITSTLPAATPASTSIVPAAVEGYEAGVGGGSVAAATALDTAAPAMAGYEAGMSGAGATLGAETAVAPSLAGTLGVAGLAAMGPIAIISDLAKGASKQDMGITPTQSIQGLQEAISTQRIPKEEIFKLAGQIMDPNSGRYLPYGTDYTTSGPVPNASSYWHDPQYTKAVEQILAQSYGPNWKQEYQDWKTFRDKYQPAIDYLGRDKTLDYNYTQYPEAGTWNNPDLEPKFDYAAIREQIKNDPYGNLELKKIYEDRIDAMFNAPGGYAPVNPYAGGIV